MCARLWQWKSQAPGLLATNSTAYSCIDRTVRVVKQWNPLTETPVLGTNYTLSPSFGRPTNKDAYQTPRTYRFAVGVRF